MTKYGCITVVQNRYYKFQDIKKIRRFSTVKGEKRNRCNNERNGSSLRKSAQFLLDPTV